MHKILGDMVMDHDLGIKLKSGKKIFFPAVLVIHENLCLRNFSLYGIFVKRGCKLTVKRFVCGAIASLVHRSHIVLLAL